MINWIASSSVIILAVVLIRALARGRILARAIYALWLLAALRLLIPGSVGTSPASVESVVGRAPVVQISERISGAESLTVSPSGQVQAHFPGEDNGTVIAENATHAQFNLMSLLLNARHLFIPVWLAGLCVTAGLFAVAGVRFAITARRRRTPLDAEGSPVPVYVSGDVDTPCLFGLFNPAIYVTPEAAADANLLRHALAHEISHYRQLDHVWCAVRCVWLALHWYNPLVWLAAKLSRRDSELACDEATVKRLGENERAEYGRSLIRMTCENPHGAAVATTMSARPKELKERIKMLTKHKNSIIALIMALALALTAAACSFTGGETDVDTAPGSVSYDSGIGGMSIFSFMAPENTGSVVLGAWGLDGGEWVQRGSWIRPCGTTEGSVGIEVDYDGGTFSLTTQIDGASFTEPENYSLNTISGAADTTWVGSSRQNDTVEAQLNSAIPLAMVSGTKNGEIYAYSGALSAFENPDYLSDPNVDCVCITLTFLPAGQMNIRGGAGQTDPQLVSDFDFTAPAGAQSLLLSYYRYNGSTWECRRETEWPCNTPEGTVTFDLDPLFSTAVSFSDGTGSSVGVIDPNEIAMTDNLGWDCSIVPDTDGAQIGIGEEIPLMRFTAAGADETYVVVTAMFLDSSSAGTSPVPDDEPPPAEIGTDAAQSAELVGFTSAFDAGESYEDIASAWVHDYASNLVLGLPEDDPAACSSVGIENYTVLAASLTQPERIIVYMSLECEPRNSDAFSGYFGQIEHLLHPIEGTYTILSRYLTLQLDGTAVTCAAAGTEMPESWGYQSLAERDDWDEYLISMSGDALVTDEELVSALNYTQMDELSNDGWMAWLEAMDAAAIAPEGTDDQVIRDMYAMLAANSADGAYATWLGNIYRAQRGHDPEAFETALSAFDSETRANIQYLADTEV